MGQIWGYLLDGLESILRAYSGLIEPVAGAYAWGFAVILLTLTVRLLLLPLAVRQTHSMRAMQKLQPELKRIQERYKVDRSMMRTDPDRYKAIRAKQQEATMALYKEHSVNPASSCLPLLLQMPIFFALFSVLRSEERLPEFATAPFFGIEGLSLTPSGGAGIGAYVMIVLLVVSTWYQSRQMASRNVAGSEQAAQQQKIMMYVMPAMMAFFSFSLPIGVLLYWVATNLWTIGQQWFIFRRLEEDAPAPTTRAGGDRRGDGGGTKGSTGTARAKGSSGSGRGGGAGGAGRRSTPKGQSDGNGTSKGRSKGSGRADDGGTPTNGSPRARNRTTPEGAPKASRDRSGRRERGSTS